MMMIRRMGIWLAFATLIVVAVLSVYVIVKQISAPTAGETLAVPVSDTDVSRGDANAAVTLLEYADFQCPACAAYHPILKQLLSEFDPHIRFVYRHFPLSQHQNAIPAAMASEAARAQGKFWEMHDMIFEHQESWAVQSNPSDTFIGYARSLNLNIARFTKDLDDPDIRDAIQRSTDGGVRSGINATPTFFINGQKIVSPQSYDGFRKLINQALPKGS